MSYNIDQISNNQGQINLLLVDVDLRVIWALQQLLRALKTTPQFKGVDFNRLEIVLEEAESSRVRVADIIPPGCVVPPPPALPPPPGGGGSGGSQYPG